MERENHRTENYVLLVNRHFTDLNPVVAGQEQCAPGHRFGPYIRQYTILHCVLSGHGSYTCGGVTYPVCAGQIFRILPGDETVYSADTADPWHYAWIGFDGKLSERMTELPPVFSVTASVMQLFSIVTSRPDTSEYVLTSALFRLYDELFGGAKTVGNEYVRKVKNYIDATYMKRISIEELAGQLHVNRRYLTRLFHKETGMSIRDYLLMTRMQAASEYLHAGAGVRDTAERCGYEDASLFSKLFRKTYGVSPAGWRAKKHYNEHMN